MYIIAFSDLIGEYNIIVEMDTFCNEMDYRKLLKKNYKI